ncbi:GIY-YIG nuclease family protein [Vibrio cholerae]
MYFIQGEVLRHVKIGYSTKSALIQRLKAHQTGSPDKLILLGIALGTRKHEAELHQRFKASKLLDFMASGFSFQMNLNNT